MSKWCWLTEVSQPRGCRVGKRPCRFWPPVSWKPGFLSLSQITPHTMNNCKIWLCLIMSKVLWASEGWLLMYWPFCACSTVNSFPSGKELCFHCWPAALHMSWRHHGSRRPWFSSVISSAFRCCRAWVRPRYSTFVGPIGRMCQFERDVLLMETPEFRWTRFLMIRLFLGVLKVRFLPFPERLRLWLIPVIRWTAFENTPSRTRSGQTTSYSRFPWRWSSKST